MLETSARLLRLLTTLQHQSEWGGPALAQRLQVTTRTLRRDVERLRTLGYAVDAEPGPGGGYRLGRGRALPPIAFLDDEAVAVAVALAGATSGFAGVEEVAVRALVKLSQLFPRRIQRRVEAMRAMILPLGGEGRIEPELLTSLALACRDQLELIFAYRSHTGAGSLRRVEPLRLALTGNRRWYLVAWDLDRAAWRTFRVDRIEARPVVGPHFLPRPPPPDLSRYIAESLSTAPYAYQARVLLHAPLAQVAPRVPPWIGVLEPDGPERCVLTTGADSVASVLRQILYTEVDFTLLDPAGLEPELSTILARLKRALPKGPVSRRRGGSSRSARP